MQQFLIGPMCVTKEDFEQKLNSCGLKFGYIKRLYEKWKDGDLTYFRIILEGSPFVIVTDDENSYPEIQEDSEKEIEPYSLEWLENLFYQSTIVGPLSYESLMPQLQMYIRVKKAEQNDEKIKQNKCPYCNEEMLDNEIGGEPIPEFGKGYAIEHGDIKAFIAKENGKYYLMHNFTPDDGYYLKMEINNCPMCGRKLEELR
ncbi:hypothetical protein [Fibrobacter sp.]|uniref:hypothetical protein n=1 Tax=Fibrobacter sp. TaxID=35828 RepID=UPI00386752F4